MPWIPALAFVVASVPTVLLLQAKDWGGDYRLLIAMVAGAAASGLVQMLLRAKGDKP